MKFKLVTNNPRVNEKYLLPENTKNMAELIYLENAGFLEVLEFVRRSVHNGHELLTHPLSGSIKPYETPYKSVIIAESANSAGGTAIVDFGSLAIIEEAIETTKKFLTDYKPRNYTEKHHEDFMAIDLHIIDSGVESARTGR